MGKQAFNFSRDFIRSVSRAVRITSALASLASLLVVSGPVCAHGGGGGGGGGGGHGGGGGGHFGGGGGHFGGGGFSGGHAGAGFSSGHAGAGNFGFGGMGHNFGATTPLGARSLNSIPGFSNRSAGLSPQSYWYLWNQNAGLWGSFARPWNWSNWSSNWAGFGMPTYMGSMALGTPYYNGVMPGLSSSYGVAGGYPDLGLNEAMSAEPDQDAPQSPPRHYKLQADKVDVCLNVSAAAASLLPPPPAGSATPSASPAPVDLASALRLGPDADITTDGRVIVYLTDDAYLLLTPKATQVIDQADGAPFVSLKPDPFLNWRIAWEIKRQSLLAQLALHNAQVDPAVAKPDSPAQKNAQAKVDLLAKAAASFGVTDDAAAPPKPSDPPMAKSTEVISSVWLVPRGEFIVLSLYDGSSVYMDAHNLYSDEGKTKLSAPYPVKLKSVITAYVSGLVADAGRMHDALNQAKQSMEDKIFALRDEADLIADSDRERTKKARQVADTLQKRVDSIDKELRAMPSEVSDATKLLTAWQ
jgi:hypothetical protein